jgi:hypothetical protein
LHHNTQSHFSFHQGIFYQKQHDCDPPPTLLACLAPCDFALFPRLKIELKGRHFDMIKAESQVVLNTLTEHYFQEAFRKR